MLKENGTQFGEKNSQPRFKITVIFTLSWKYFNRIMIKLSWLTFLVFIRYGLACKYGVISKY